MWNKPLLVALVGAKGTLANSLLASLSPAIHPLICRDWAELQAQMDQCELESVVIFPHVTEEAPFPLNVPYFTLEEADLFLPPGRIETRILTHSGEFQPVQPQFQLLGKSASMTRVRATLVTAARTGLPLLITGQNGTGKDLAAQLAHKLSSRSSGDFIPVNCGAIPPGLAETELFGCVRGAFTGAENRPGVCQLAHNGSLFLDEVGELTPEIQAKLLRALDNKEVRRVGSGRVETVDFRLICATNRDLASEVKSGRFREDLYYRINVLTLKIPTLKERMEDLPLLAAHFLQNEACGNCRPVSLGPGALAKMADYHWPGNLRQLRNVLLRATVMTSGTELGPEDIVWD